MDDFRSHLIKHRLAVSEISGDAKALGRALGPGPRQITDTNDIYTRQLVEASQVLTGDLPSAYQGGFHDTSLATN